MLLTNRRHRLIHFCLLGMELAWITPFLLLLYRPWQVHSLLLIFGGLFLLLLAWILIIEILSRFILKSPQYELAVATLIALTTVILLRLIVYGRRSLFDFSWLLHTLQAMSSLATGLAPEWLVVLINFLVWLRATNATSREIDFWHVGLSFRAGMLMLILAGGLLHQFSPLSGLPFLWLFFTFGLTAVALTRISEKSADMRSSGPLLPASRLAQLLLAVAVTMTLALGLTYLYNPDTLKALFRWLLPLLTALGQVLLLVLSAILWLIGPILLWLSQLLANLFNSLDLSGLGQAIDSFRNGLDALAANERGEPFRLDIPTWVWVFLRYLGLTAALIFLLAVVMLFLDKIRARSVRDQPEDEAEEAITLGGGALQEGLTQLLNLVRLVARYGLGQKLLAAISIENMYANLCRLARQQGYPRHPAQPPDDYLSRLNLAFVDQESALARMTSRYMRVHYGGRELSRAELEQARDDYDRIRQAQRSESGDTDER